MGESTCNDNSDTSAKWWLIAGSSMGILCCAFILVIVTYIYKITKDDHELVMLSIQRKQPDPVQQEQQQEEANKQTKPNELKHVQTHSVDDIEIDQSESSKAVNHTIKIDRVDTNGRPKNNFD